MSQLASLPNELNPLGFSVAEARKLGVPKARLYAEDLVRPHHGIRTRAAVESVAERCIALAPKIHGDRAFSGFTGADLWGLPLPTGTNLANRPLEMLVGGSTSRLQRKGVTSRRISQELFRKSMLDGIPVSSPVLALITSARELAVEWIVVMLEALLTTAEHYPRLRLTSLPHLQISNLPEMFDKFRGISGMDKLRAAGELARAGSESPMESRTRLKLVEAGLPEPTLQHEVQLSGDEKFRSDMAYPIARLLIDYDGAGHFADAETILSDLRRSRMLQSVGWMHLRITHEDLAGERLDELVATIKSRIAQGIAAGA